MSKSSRLHKKVVNGDMTAKDAIDQALAHGHAAGRASMKAEIVAIVEKMKTHPTIATDAIGAGTLSCALTRIERTPE